MRRLLAALDLRFADPKVESHYHNYYANVKKNLLPTAIKVVLLVNGLFFLVTCLASFRATSTSSSLSSSWDSSQVGLVVLPLILQIAIFVVSFSMLRLVLNQLDPTKTDKYGRRRISSAARSVMSDSDSHSLESGLSRHSNEADDDDDQDAQDMAGIKPLDKLVETIELSGGKTLVSLKPCKKSRESDHRRQTKLKWWRSKIRISLPYALWLCQLIQLYTGLWSQQSFISYSTSLLYVYSIYVIFPIRLKNCAFLALSLSSSQLLVDYLIFNNLSKSPQRDSSLASSLEPDVSPSATTSTPAIGAKEGVESPNDNPLLLPMTSEMSKLWAFLILTLAVNVIGVMSFFFYERQQRAAFLETRQSIETKLILEQESKEQERLLLSILPQHLASEIRQEMGAVVTGQFKKIYMSRHENVSILFADIVGFTAISSHCPAPELVKILNELFARFDKLAERYHQLRIKILGDCYYAISGAPQERPDHAVLCVHMGLSMVEAIKSVRERTKSTVDMRVGVHTGAVLAGVLGQRQWQFDVYSKDVELANKLESSGLPGRVHISHATLRFLNDEFQVSEGDGASREEALRLANIKTYFIERVLKPYPEGTLDAHLPGPEQRASEDSSQASHANRRSKSPRNQAKLNNNNGNINKQKHQDKSKELNDSFNFDKQIKQFSLNFADRQVERQFRSTSGIAYCISIIGLPITLICATIAYFYLYYNYHFDQYILTLTLLCICWALFLMNRQFELTNRRLFLWRKQVEERKKRVADMREKNEALVYNILPPNVAKIFLGKRTLSDEELYSKSYDAVGVLFAAMPNFSDFYTEESVNNQGLECLRFLNEVISDYDALLDQDRFKNIIKIKTMGSTYMAASGLYEGDALEASKCKANSASATSSTNSSSSALANGTHQSSTGGQTDSAEDLQLAIRSKWGHLEQLTEFALALKDTLNNINKESFNNFVLRIGINQGPITAGVIGIKKPHFDMWGNTVNVASRMESTGRAGSIQVVEETATILQTFGFQFDQRGLVSVKGKGKLMTFYLTGRRAAASTTASMATVTAPPVPGSASTSALASIAYSSRQQN